MVCNLKQRLWDNSWTICGVFSKSSEVEAVENNLYWTWKVIVRVDRDRGCSWGCVKILQFMFYDKMFFREVFRLYVKVYGSTRFSPPLNCKSVYWAFSFSLKLTSSERFFIPAVVIIDPGHIEVHHINCVHLCALTSQCQLMTKG